MACAPLTSTTPRRPNRAFTLIELLVVMVIVALVSSIALPRYADALMRYHLDAAAHRIAGDLELAARRADASSQTITLRFFVATDRYTIPALADPDDPSQRYTVALDETPYDVDLTDADFAGAAEVKFNGFGLPGAGGTVSIQRGSQTRTVTLDSQTGKVTIP